VAWAILDTSIYIEHWERGLHEAALSEIRARFVVRQSSVVLSELRRGARTAAAKRLVDGLRRLAPIIWTPASDDWWEAARLIRTIGDAQDWETNKRREFQNDALIALGARRYGATVVTTNRGDFRLLQRKLRFDLLTIDSTS
jgi:predicted nucleic acid-binding protein